MTVRDYRASALAIILIALWVRFLGFDREPWLDEIFTLYDATLSWAGLTRGDHPPVLHLILGVLNPNDSAAIARAVMLVTALFSFGAFLWATRGVGRAGSLFGLIFLVSVPAVLNYGVEIRMYGVLVLLACLVMGEARKVENRAPTVRNSTGLAIWLVLAVLTHAVGIFLVPAALAMMFFPGAKGRPAPAVSGLVALVPLGATLCWLWLYHMKDKLSNTNWISPTSLSYTLETLGEVFAGSPSQEWFQATWVVSGLLFCLLFVGKGGGRFLIGGVFYFGPLLLFSVAFKPILLYRTLLPAVPFVAAFAAARFQSLLDRRYLTIALCSLLALYAGLTHCYWIGIKSKECSSPMKAGCEPVARSIDREDYVICDWVLGPCSKFYFPDHPGDRVLGIDPRNPDLEFLPSDATVYLLLWDYRDGEPLALQERVRDGRKEKLLFESDCILLFRYWSRENKGNPPPYQ